MRSRRRKEWLRPNEVNGVEIIYAKDDSEVEVPAEGNCVVVAPYLREIWDIDYELVYVVGCYVVAGIVDGRTTCNGVPYFHKEIRVERKFSGKPRWFIDYRLARIIYSAARAVS